MKNSILTRGQIFTKIVLFGLAFIVMCVVLMPVAVFSFILGGIWISIISLILLILDAFYLFKLGNEIVKYLENE